MPNTKNLDNFTISLIALSTIKGIGRKKIQTLINEMDNPFQSGYLSYVEKGIEINIFSRMTPISIFLEAREKAYEIIDICDKNHISIASSGESVFPDSLKFEGGPNLIYYQGDLNLLSKLNRVAVVGTRVPTETGRQFSYRMGQSLGKEKITVISGLATGCDTGGHLGCLDSHGKTVAFLPSNLTDIMPRSNVNLARKIIDEEGCLVSEFSPKDINNAFMFIERDRLQAQVSDYVIVSEFEENSGTLHTLKFANSFGKEIIANKAIVKSGVSGYNALDELHIPYTKLSEIEIYDYIVKHRLMS